LEIVQMTEKVWVCTTTQETVSSIAMSSPPRRRRRKLRHFISGQPRHGRDGLAIVRMQIAGDERLAPPSDAVRHQHRLGAAVEPSYIEALATSMR